MLGELSMFHQTHGFYVHGLSLEAASLPSGWEKRAQVVQNANTQWNKGICVEAHDLAASKLVAFREKDRMFVRVLLSERMIKPSKLIRLINLLPRPKEDKDRLTEWVDLTAEEIERTRPVPK